MKYIKYALVITLCVLSFYASDRLILYVENLSPLMKEIKMYEDSLYESPVNAIIEDNTIITGKKGRELNKRESYLKMNDFGSFNETFFVYDYIKPEISVMDHLDKVIIGNVSDTDVALIVDNKTIEEYLLTEKIKFSKIVKEQDEINKKEITYINGASNEDDFNDIRRFLKKNNLNKNICMIDISNHFACINTKSFIIKPTIELKSSNISSYVNNTKGGSIIKIDKNLTLNEFKVYLSKLKYNNLEIVDLIDLIKE